MLAQAWGSEFRSLAPTLKSEIWAHSIRTHLAYIHLSERNLFLIHNPVISHTAYLLPLFRNPPVPQYPSYQKCFAVCAPSSYELSIWLPHVRRPVTYWAGKTKLNPLLWPCHCHPSHLSHGCTNHSKLCVASHTLDSDPHIHICVYGAIIFTDYWACPSSRHFDKSGSSHHEETQAQPSELPV